MADEEPPKNAFVRWKRHVDSHISTTLHNAIGLPSAISRSFHPSWVEVKETRPGNKEELKQLSENAKSSSISLAAQSIQTRNQFNQPYARACPMNGDSSNRNFPSSNGESSDDDGSNNSRALTTWPDWVQLARWHSFAAYSPYSPLNLRSIPQPRPTSLSADHTSFFTFEDAFEDLLAVMCGKEMQDLMEKAEMRKVLDKMFPSGEPGFYWVRRLQAESLLDGYFPRAEHMRRQLEESYLGDEEVKKQRELNEKRSRVWQWVWNRHHPVEKTSNKDERSFEDCDVEDWIKELDSVLSQTTKDMREEFNNGHIFGELERIFKTIGNLTGAFIDSGQEGRSQEEKQQFKDDEEPETEEDHFSAISKTPGSASTSGNVLTSTSDDALKEPINTWKKIWDERYKEFHEQDQLERSKQQQQLGPTHHSTTEESIDSQTGVRTVKTTEEKIDKNGNRTVRTEIRKVNADGAEVSRQSSFSRSMSASWSWSSSPDVNSNSNYEELKNEKPSSIQSSLSGDEKEKNQKTGWFWK